MQDSLLAGRIKRFLELWAEVVEKIRNSVSRWAVLEVQRSNESENVGLLISVEFLEHLTEISQNEVDKNVFLLAEVAAVSWESLEELKGGERSEDLSVVSDFVDELIDDLSSESVQVWQIIVQIGEVSEVVGLCLNELVDSFNQRSDTFFLDVNWKSVGAELSDREDQIEGFFVKLNEDK